MGNAADFLGAEAGQILADLVQGNIIKKIDESVRTFIERGHFDQNLTANGTISKVLKEVPLNTIEVVQLGEIRKEGKICKVPLDLYVKDYDGNIRIEFMMRDKGWNWQIAELSNLSTAVNELKELKRTLPYRKLDQTALYLARSIKDNSSRSSAISEIAVEVAKTGKTEMADSLFTEALGVARLIENIDNYTLSNIISKYAGNIAMPEITKMALDFAKSIKDKNRRVYTFYRIAVEIAESGRIDLAMDITKSIEDIYRYDQVLSLIVVQMSKSEKAGTVLDIANSIGDSGSRLLALSSVATEMAKSGKTEMADNILSEALVTAKSNKNIERRDMSFAAIALSFAQSGKLQMALDIVKSIENIYIRSYAFFNIAVELAKSGKMEMADRLFSEAIDVAKSIEDGRQRLNAFSNLAVELAKLGKMEMADRLFSEAIDMAKSIYSYREQSDGKLCDIAVDLAKSGKMEMALQTVNSIDKNRPSRRNISLTSIALNLSQQQMTKDQEKQLATRIMNMR